MQGRVGRGYGMWETLVAMTCCAIPVVIGTGRLLRIDTTCKSACCNSTAAEIQRQVDRFEEQFSQLPQHDLADLHRIGYLPTGVPVCPEDGVRYELRGQAVVCPLHPVDTGAGN